MDPVTERFNTDMHMQTRFGETVAESLAMQSTLTLRRQDHVDRADTGHSDGARKELNTAAGQALWLAYSVHSKYHLACH